MAIDFIPCEWRILSKVSSKSCCCSLQKELMTHTDALFFRFTTACVSRLLHFWCCCYVVLQMIIFQKDDFFVVNKYVTHRKHMRHSHMTWADMSSLGRRERKKKNENSIWCPRCTCHHAVVFLPGLVLCHIRSLLLLTTSHSTYSIPLVSWHFCCRRGEKVQRNEWNIKEERREWEIDKQPGSWK
jgi:hypothetical protein